MQRMTDAMKMRQPVGVVDCLARQRQCSVGIAKNKERHCKMCQTRRFEIQTVTQRGLLIPLWVI